MRCYILTVYKLSMSMSMSICCYLYSSFFYYLVDLLPCFYLHHISHQSPNWCGRTRLQTWILMWSKTKNKYKLVSFANHFLFLRFRQLKNLLCVCDAYASCGVSNFFVFFFAGANTIFIHSFVEFGSSRVAGIIWFLNTF